MKAFTLKRKELLAGDTLLLTLQPMHESDKLRFWPGQYAALGFRQDGRPTPMRCFSLVSSPRKPDELQFAMKIEGKFTQTAAKLESGDEVFVKGPFGNFVIDPDIDRRVIMIAGGIGITPFMSMLRYAAEVQLDIPITLLYSCKSQADIPFFDELLELEHRNPKLKVVFFITNGDVNKLNGARAVRSRLDISLLNQITSGQFKQFTFFICGPKSFMKAMELNLLRAGTEPERIVSEAFSQSSKAQALTAWPKMSLSRLTYALTGLTLLVGTGLIMVTDLARSVPKIVNAESANSTQTPTTSTSSTSSTPDTTTTNNTTLNSSQSTSAQTAPTYQTYQSPVTSVS